MSTFEEHPGAGGASQPDSGMVSGSSPYKPVRDLDPWISCLLQGLSMGVSLGFITGILSGLLIQLGILNIPFIRLYGTLTGVSFYIVWTSVCICAGVPLCELFCIIITPWRHIRRRNR